MKIRDILLVLLLLASVGALFFLSGNDDEQEYEINIEFNKDDIFNSKFEAYEKRHQEEKSVTGNPAVSIFDIEEKTKNDVIKREETKIQNKKELEALSKQLTPSPNSVKQQKKATVTQTRSRKTPPPSKTPITTTQANRKALMASWGNVPQPDKKVAIDVVVSAGYSAVVHKNQAIYIGERVTLRTTQEIKIRNHTIPAHTFITGISSNANNRLAIRVTNVNYNGTIIPLNMQVYALDGLLGLPLSLDKVGSDVTKEITDGAITTASSIIGSVGGSFGRAIAGLANSAAKGVQNEKQVQIFLLDKQKLTLKQ